MTLVVLMSNSRFIYLLRGPVCNLFTTPGQNATSLVGWVLATWVLCRNDDYFAREADVIFDMTARLRVGVSLMQGCSSRLSTAPIICAERDMVRPMRFELILSGT